MAASAQQLCGRVRLLGVGGYISATPRLMTTDRKPRTIYNRLNALLPIARVT